MIIDGSRPRLPFAEELSPGVVRLSTVLDIFGDHAGDRAAVLEALRQACFLGAAAKREDSAERLKQQRTRAYNVVCGMHDYELAKDDKLSELGEQLRQTADDGQRSRRFAKHILIKLHGLELLAAVRSLQARGVRVTKKSLADELDLAGIDLPRATTHHLMMVAWLREAGVVGAGSSNYDIDVAVLRDVAGVDLVDVEEWGSLSDEQQAFLRSLRRMAELSGQVQFKVKDVVDQTQVENGRVFAKPDQLRATVYGPLDAQGWIRLVRASSGRGGKSGDLVVTDRLLDTALEALTGYSSAGVPPDIRRHLSMSLGEIMTMLHSDNTHEKGIALEVLAVRLAADASLAPTKFRLRSRETGGAEVDVVAEGAHLQHSRWLFQCKNTPKVSLSALAKEVGLAWVLHAHVVVIATTGVFATSVRDFADQTMRETSLQVVLIDGALLASYQSKGPSALLSHLKKCARDALELKASQLDRAVRE